MSGMLFERFIESWGTMGTMWGINRSTARIHALLMTSDNSLHLDQISTELNISRGNVSMGLKELCSWGIVIRSNLPGDRRDYFSADPDVWSMLFKIARERKRREFNPAFKALKELLETHREQLGKSARNRLEDLERVFATVDRLLDGLLGEEQKGKSVFGFLTDMVLRRGSH